MGASAETVPNDNQVDAPAKKHVLVIDDDASIRLLLSMGLRLRGFSCQVAENGVVAQTVVQSGRFDAIIVDLMMPLMDGLSFIDWLRQTANVKTPVLVLTSVHDPNTTFEAISSGANGVAFKPIRMAQVMEELTKMVSCPG